MAHNDIPHFDFPFRFETHQGGLTASEVEQDSIEDISNCINVICLTPLGWFAESPNFGLPDLTFNQQPLNVSELSGVIVEQEPRAVLIIEEAPDRYDELVARIKVQVARRGGTVV